MESLLPQTYLLGLIGLLAIVAVVVGRQLLRVRRDEQNLGQIKGNFEVMIAELAVLFRIEHFEKSRRRVPSTIRADLVDLIEHHHGVPGPRFA